MTKRAPISCWLIAALLGAVLLPTGATEASPLKPMKGAPSATEFVLPDLGGKTVRLSDFKGNVVLINFWATWCLPCAKEAPALERLWQTYRSRGFVILAVSLDRSSQEKVKAFVEEYRMTFPVLHDPDDLVSPGYLVFGLPTSVLITPNGRVAYRVVGEYDYDSPEMKQAVEQFLGGVAR